MGKYKRIFYVFSIIISFFLINIDVLANSMIVTPSQFRDNYCYTPLSGGSGSCGTEYYTNIVTSTILGTSSFGFTSNVERYHRSIRIDYDTHPFDTTRNYNVSFMIQTGQARTENSTAPLVAVNQEFCYVQPLISDSESPSNIYSVICDDIRITSTSMNVMIYLDQDITEQLSSQTFGITRYWGYSVSDGKELSEIATNTNETNSLLESANQKQQQMINAQTQTNSKLDENKQAVNENTAAVNNQTNTMKDSNSSEATDEAGSFFSGFESDTFGLTSIITAPLNLIQSVTSSTCSTMGIPVPFVENTTLELPCLRGIYERHFGSFLDIYQTITFGIVAYWVCVRIFALVKDFKNPDHDEIEVLDL